MNISTGLNIKRFKVYVLRMEGFKYILGEFNFICDVYENIKLALESNPFLLKYNTKFLIYDKIRNKRTVIGLPALEDLCGVL